MAALHPSSDRATIPAVVKTPSGVLPDRTERLRALTAITGEAFPARLLPRRGETRVVVLADQDMEWLWLAAAVVSGQVRQIRTRDRGQIATSAARLDQQLQASRKAAVGEALDDLAAVDAGKPKQLRPRELTDADVVAGRLAGELGTALVVLHELVSAIAPVASELIDGGALSERTWNAAVSLSTLVVQ